MASWRLWLEYGKQLAPTQVFQQRLQGLMKWHLPRRRLFSGTGIPDKLDAPVLHIRDSGSSKNNMTICAVLVLV